MLGGRRGAARSGRALADGGANGPSGAPLPVDRVRMRACGLGATGIARTPRRTPPTAHQRVAPGRASACRPRPAGERAAQASSRSSPTLPRRPRHHRTPVRLVRRRRPHSSPASHARATWGHSGGNPSSPTDPRATVACSPRGEAVPVMPRWLAAILTRRTRTCTTPDSGRKRVSPSVRGVVRAGFRARSAQNSWTGHSGKVQLAPEMGAPG